MHPKIEIWRYLELNELARQYSFIAFCSSFQPPKHDNGDSLEFPFCLLISFFSVPSLALSAAGGSLCSDSVFPNNQVFALCTNLPYLDSFLHWTDNPSSSTL
ncbi:hypothetical protein RHMOL_Rhmol02G0106900 [Rhododendron molle]|uniref:Uncharacterized protein n=1 Tax=Rhododendron molle TaxID=49168 RepID=A0ACC0PQ20_RHOML|nr:hypothetical protein RHMOL_Rhmol02G0106900 [Rhododendron molle]